MKNENVYINIINLMLFYCNCSFFLILLLFFFNFDKTDLGVNEIVEGSKHM